MLRPNEDVKEATARDGKSCLRIPAGGSTTDVSVYRTRVLAGNLDSEKPRFYFPSTVPPASNGVGEQDRNAILLL